METGTAGIYLDYAATTPLDERVLDAMLPYFRASYGNPSSLYHLGRAARAAIDGARQEVAAALGARPTEIVFTSGGTESDNSAIKGVLMARMGTVHQGPPHLITGATEHEAVLRACEWVERIGCEVTILPVDADGRVSPEMVEQALRPTTALVSLMFGNNEIGTLHPIAHIAEMTRRRGVPLHTDAIQAAGLLPLDVETLGVDLLSISAHKFYGPKGVGALYVRRGTPWLPQQVGGGQERGRRAGTENTAGIVGLATALRLALESIDAEPRRLARLRDRLQAGLLAAIPAARINGHPTERLPNNLNIMFPEADGESLLLHLDTHGISASSGSACTAGSLDPSHVLTAIGVPRETAITALRLSLGRQTTEEEIDQVVRLVPAAVERLHQMSGTSSL